MAPRATAGLIVAAWLFGAASATAGDDPSKTTIRGTVVDEASRPVADATVQVLGNKKADPVTTGEDGAFRFDLDTPRVAFATLIASNDDGGRLAYAHYDGSEPEGEVRLELKPAAEITAVVTGRDGEPVRDAEVYVLTDYNLFTGGRTDEAGRWTGRVPQGPRYWAVFARKSGVGFDYLDLGYPPQDAPPHPYPAEVAFTLDGARSVRVTTVGRDGKPVAGVMVGPWYIKLPGEANDVNLSGTSELWPKTGDDGTAVIDWLPEKFERAIPILALVEGYYTPDQISIREEAPVEELTHTLLPQTTLSGRVTHADGRPAAGILVHAEGHGATYDPCRQYARTDADGRYEMTVDTEMAYIIAVESDAFAAPNITGLLIRADGGPVEGQDFVLGPGTVLRGRVTLGDDRKPVADETITVLAVAGTIPKELEREGDNVYRPVQLVRWARTDAEGRYEIRLGAGTYNVRGPARTENISLDLPAENPPAEVTGDFHMPRPETGSFTVTVVDGDGKPVAGAGVVGKYRAFTGRGWYQPIKTDENGRLKTERSLDPVVLYASNDDESLAGLARSDAEETEARIVIAPTTTATGTLLDKEGNALAGKELTYGIRIHSGPDKNSPFSWNFGGTATTDAAGRFTLTGLVPGESYDVEIAVEKDRTWRSVTTVTPEDTSPVDLGELKVDPNPTPPYVPPTPEKRVADAFAAKADVPPAERLTDLLAEARREYTRPLLLFGRTDDPAGVDLYRLFYEPREPQAEGEESAERPKAPRDLRWEFELAALDLGRPEVRELATKLGVPTGEGDPPVLVALTDDGSPAATHPLVLSDGKLDREALAAFLLAQKLPTRDAEWRLAEALAKAEAEDKRVFLIASASWCGPCRLLARFLDPHKQELEKHYVFVKLDVSRDDHGGAVRDRHQRDRDGGIPWYVILDADGKELATSNLPESAGENAGENIGYPGSPDGAEHFLNMLRETAPGLPEETLAAMTEELAN